ncbi:MAG: hypothetical protein QW796_02975 [Thermoproteota archaeon]
MIVIGSVSDTVVRWVVVTILVVVYAISWAPAIEPRKKPATSSISAAKPMGLP